MEEASPGIVEEASPGPFSVVAFSCAKAGNAPSEYEDAWCGSDGASRCRVGVADGATESSFSGLWARLLVETYARRSEVGGDFFDQLAPARRLWRMRCHRDNMPWYAKEKLKSGAFAAFVGLELSVAGRTWKAVAIGDSCVFQLDRTAPDTRLVTVFPLTKSKEFAASPYLVGTKLGTIRDVRDHQKLAEGALRDRDVMLVTTDAISAWLLRRQEDGKPVWNEVTALSSQAEFDAFVASARQDGMRNDDVTLVRVTFSGEK
jgi:hypothetical protein